MRALAVVAVLLYHLFPHVFIGGYLGVDVFFVISGFIITTLLIREHVTTGRIALKKFWLRRARRLLPALFVTILGVCSLVFFIRGDIMVGIGQQVLGAATFSSNWIEILLGTNYFTSTSHLFMNFWSLAVEEQFYLLWPFATLFIVAKVKRPWVGMIGTGLAALISAGWMAYLFYSGASTSRIYYGTDTHIFGLMIGALLAFWSYHYGRFKAARRLMQPFWFIRRFPIASDIVGVSALIGLGALFLTLSDQSALAYSGGLFIACLLTAAVLIVTVGKAGLLQNFFELPQLIWLGKRSYGIYLWHWPLIVLGHLLFPTLAAWLLACFVIITTLSCTTLSYYFVETPIRTYGFRAVCKKALIAVDSSAMRIRRRPHSITLVVLLAIGLTIASVVTAPTKTAAQLRVEAGERLVKKQEAQKKSHPPAPPLVITDGSQITAVGDSVMLAGSPALEAKYPGIIISAEVSRSLRRGGLETIQQLQATGQLRRILIIGLGTNGYFGPGNLEALVSQLPAHKIVLVTAYADREWTPVNNQDIAIVAKKYKNVAVADWNQAISPHPDLLAEDGVHPKKEGDALYINAISSALSRLR